MLAPPAVFGEALTNSATCAEDGAVAVTCLVVGQTVWVANVGDSKVRGTTRLSGTRVHCGLLARRAQAVLARQKKDSAEVRPTSECSRGSRACVHAVCAACVTARSTARV